VYDNNGNVIAGTVAVVIAEPLDNVKVFELDVSE
jgi:hypothetical protein